MKTFKNLKVRTKLMIAFTICILITGFITFASVTMVNISQTAGDNRYDHYGVTGSMLGMSFAEFNSVRAYARNAVFVYTDNEEAQQQSIDAIEKHTELAKNYLEQFRANINEEDTELVTAYEQLLEDLEAYITVIDEIIVLAEDDKLTEAEELLTSEGDKLYAEVETIILETEDILSEYSAANDADIEKQIDILKLILIVMGIAGAVIAIIFEFILSRNILASLNKMSQAAHALAKGDISVNMKRESKDEFGDVMEEMAVMANSIKEQANIARHLADGDLTVEIVPKSEKDVLGHALKKLIEENNSTIGNIQESAMQVSTGAEQVASASNSLAQGTTEQASAIEQISASVVEIAEKTRINASDANEANSLVMETKEDAVRGNTQMKEMIHAMDEINESSENISKIIKVIDDIAFQTNILALNAAVEAARAGSHGKGFAVVAEEVRNLAGKSASAASETAEMIEDSIRKVENGAKLAQETAAALENIVNAVDNIVNLVNAITTASNEQATAIAQIDQAVSQVAQVVQTNSATSQQCAAASDELANQVERVKTIMSKYRLRETKFSSYYGDSYDKGNSFTPQISLDDDVYRIEDNNSSSISFTGGYGKY